MTERESGFLAEIVAISPFWTTLEGILDEKYSDCAKNGGADEPRSGS